MKILKKLFLIGLFSFVFFISNVNALETNYSITYRYDETFYNNIISGNRLSNIHTYLDNNMLNYIDTNTIIQINPQSDTQWQLFIYKIPVRSNNRIYARTCSSSDDYSICSALYGESGWYIYNFTFDSDDNIINSSNSFRSSDAWPQIAWNYSAVNSDIVDNNYVLIISDKYYDTFYLDNSSTMNVYDASSSEKDIPIKFNDTTYSIGNIINSKEFFDSFIPYIEEPLNCNKSQVLGLLTNVSDFTFRIKGISDVLSEPIRGRFTFSYQKPDVYTKEDFNVELVNYTDNEIVGKYELVCPDDDYACYIDYSYNYVDDIDEEIEFGFNVTPVSGKTLPSIMHFYNCYHNDVYYDISYTYNNNLSNTTNNTDSSLNNLLNDSSNPDLGMFNNMNTLLPPGPVDSILTLPLSVLNSLQTSLGGQCSNLTVTLPFVNSDITLPCIRSFYDSTGFLSFFELTGTIASVIILLQYFTFLYNWLDNVMRLGNSQLETWGAEEEFKHFNGEV